MGAMSHVKVTYQNDNSYHKIRQEMLALPNLKKTISKLHHAIIEKISYTDLFDIKTEEVFWITILKD